MGLGTSKPQLNIYLLTTEKQYPRDRKDYFVTISKKIVPKSKNFEEITHKITYNSDPKNFDIHVYNTESQPSDHSYRFSYLSPTKTSEFVEEVKVYYSIFASYIPLIISLITQDKKIYQCTSDALRIKSVNASAIKSYTFEADLKHQLKEEFNKLLSNNRIQFTIGDGSGNIGTIAYDKEIKNDERNYKRIYIPLALKSTLGSECLLDIDDDKHVPKCSGPLDDSDKNKIDPYFFGSVNKPYRGIILYFSRNGKKNKDTIRGKEDTLVLLEFIDSVNSKKYIRRKDLHGYWWSEEPVLRKNDAALSKSLNDIKLAAYKKHVAVVILDKMAKYKGVKNVKPEPDSSAYNKYTYEFQKAKRPVTLYNREEKKIAHFDENFRTKNVEVYYLKHKECQEEDAKCQEDSEPFLIVFEVHEAGTKLKPDNETRHPENNKKIIYHFNGKYGLKNWEEFRKSNKIKDIEQNLKSKLEKIEAEWSDLDNMDEIREKAYEILRYPDEYPVEDEEDDSRILPETPYGDPKENEDEEEEEGAGGTPPEGRPDSPPGFPGGASEVPGSYEKSPPGNSGGSEDDAGLVPPGPPQETPAAPPTKPGGGSNEGSTTGSESPGTKTPPKGTPGSDGRPNQNIPSGDLGGPGGSSKPSTPQKPASPDQHDRDDEGSRTQPESSGETGVEDNCDEYDFDFDCDCYEKDDDGAGSTNDSKSDPNPSSEAIPPVPGAPTFSGSPAGVPGEPVADSETKENEEYDDSCDIYFESTEPQIPCGPIGPNSESEAPSENAQEPRRTRRDAVPRSPTSIFPPRSVPPTSPDPSPPDGSGPPYIVTILIVVLGIVVAGAAAIGTILGRKLLSNLATRTITNMVPSL